LPFCVSMATVTCLEHLLVAKAASHAAMATTIQQTLSSDLDLVVRQVNTTTQYTTVLEVWHTREHLLKTYLI